MLVQKLEERLVKGSIYCKRRTAVSELESVMQKFSLCERITHIHFTDPIAFSRFVQNTLNRIVTRKLLRIPIKKTNGQSSAL